MQQFKSDVKSRLARSERNEKNATQCSSRYDMRGRYGLGLDIVQCERPSNAHRVHQSGGVQWERSNLR